MNRREGTPFGEQPAAETEVTASAPTETEAPAYPTEAIGRLGSLRREEAPARSEVRQSGGRVRPEIRRSVVVFVDIVGCSEVSASVDIDTYDLFVAEYQKAAHDAAQQARQHYRDVLSETSIRGDEALLILHCPNVARDDPRHVESVDAYARVVVEKAFQFCHFLKFAWYQSNHNRARYRLNMPPRDLAMGIVWGWLTFGQRMDGTSRSEGYLLNIAKRVESVSRMGEESKIFYTEPIHHFKLPNMRARERRGIELKGFTVPQTVYELVGLHTDIYQRWEGEWKVDPEFASDKEAVHNFLQVARGSSGSWLKDMASIFIAKQGMLSDQQSVRSLAMLTGIEHQTLTRRLIDEHPYTVAQAAMGSVSSQRIQAGVTE